ncbi:MAG: glycosyltransferase, partial [Thermocrispum sp.]
MSRYAMWTPLPPQRSGIADYSFELLQPLAGLVDITGVTDGPRQTCASHGVLVIGPAEVPAGTKHIYQLGNHTGAHAWMYRQILREPGVLVLHDSTLLDFYIGLHGGIEAPEFVAEVNHAHGMIRGRHDDPALMNGWPAVEVYCVRVLDLGTLTMERRVVEASSAVIVHDPATAKWLRERYRDKPVYVVPSAAPIHEQPSCESARAKHGYSPHEVVFGVFGGLGRIKRILVVLLAFAEVRRHRPDAQLIIAGHPDDPDVTAGIEQAIAQYGLHEAVKLVLSPGKSTFEELICSTDAVVNLRWPTAGETSGVMMRAFGAGKVVITTDLPQHAHYDSEYCLRLPHDPADESAMLIKT